MGEPRSISVLEPVRLIFASRERRCALAAFVILYAWEYLTFFSSTLTKGAQTLAPTLPERCWAAAGLALAVCAAVLLMRRRTKQLRFPPMAYLAAAALMGVGCLAVWLAFTYRIVPEVLPYVFAGLVGAATPFMYLYRIDHFPDLEASFLGTFFGLVSVFSLLVYLACMLLPTVCAVAFCVLAPIAFVLLGRGLPHLEEEVDAASTCADVSASGTAVPLAAADETHTPVTGFPVKPLLLNYATAFVLIVWLNFAFFRVIAAPWDFESRSWYNPSVFVTTLLVILVLFLAIRKTASRKHQRGQARFAIVVFAVSYLVLYVRFYTPILAVIAFSFCFACMIALEALAWSFWYQAVKRQRRFAAAPLLTYLVAKGLGIFVGVVLGEQVCLITEGIIPATAPLFFLVVLFACGMALKLEDFDKMFIGDGEPRALQGYETDFGRLVIADAIELSDGEPVGVPAPDAPAAPAAPASPTPLGADTAVDILAERFGLSPRETDVARLLLAGRNRPYIKEALFISVGTVNSHISNIYRKTGVNSQQELISLAESITDVG